MPRAIEWAENMKEKLRFHRFSCHGSYGLSYFPSSLSHKSTLTLPLFLKLAYTSRDKRMLHRTSSKCRILIPKSMEDLADKVDEEHEEKFSVESFTVSL